MRMRSLVKSLALKLLLASLLLPTSLPAAASEQSAAQEQPASAQQASEAGATAAPGDGSAVPDVVDEDFVIASLLISDPGGALYSRLGHAALHMQCPAHNLDYVFTYEAEDIKGNPLGFLAGKLNMGMAALDPEEYIREHVERQRGLKEYKLNLPVEYKRELWRSLDNHLMEGMNLKYDYLRYGCAHSTLMMLKEGLGKTPIRYGAWPEHFKGATRREVTYHHIHEDKWTTFLLHFIVNGVIDKRGCSNEDKVIIPADLPFILSNATVDGMTVIDSEPQVIVPEGKPLKTGWLSPMLIAWLLLALTIVCALRKWRVMDYVLLGIQTLLGIVAVWLVFFSTLCCTEWSWLIIPFNPLPLIFWKWRRHWALPYAIVLLVWCAFMFFSPHLLTDDAYIICALSLAIDFFNAKYQINQ